MNSLLQSGNWVTSVTISLPDYASQMGNRLESVIKDTALVLTDGILIGELDEGNERIALTFNKRHFSVLFVPPVP